VRGPPAHLAIRPAAAKFHRGFLAFERTLEGPAGVEQPVMDQGATLQNPPVFSARRRHSSASSSDRGRESGSEHGEGLDASKKRPHPPGHSAGTAQAIKKLSYDYTLSWISIRLSCKLFLQFNIAMKSILTTLIVSALGMSVLAESAPKKPAAAKDAEPPVAARKAVDPLSPSEKTQLLKLLNEGDTAALTGLPGIGEGRAAAIQKARPFADPAELAGVEGVGLATLNGLVTHAKAGFPAETVAAAQTGGAAPKKKTAPANPGAAKKKKKSAD
jgi:DNA uptake protein ComE-like DNA-binding protein